VLRRIALLAIAAPRRIIAVAALVMVACGIFGIPVAKHLSAGGFQDPTSGSTQATKMLADKFGPGRHGTADHRDVSRRLRRRLPLGPSVRTSPSS